MHTKVRGFIEAMIEVELKTALSRPVRQIGHVHHLLTSDLRDWRRLGSGARHLLKRGHANWRVRLPRYEEHSLRHRSAHSIDLISFTQQSLPKERVAGARS